MQTLARRQHANTCLQPLVWSQPSFSDSKPPVQQLPRQASPQDTKLTPSHPPNSQRGNQERGQLEWRGLGRALVRMRHWCWGIGAPGVVSSGIAAAALVTSCAALVLQQACASPLPLLLHVPLLYHCCCMCLSSTTRRVPLLYHCCCM